MKRHRIKAVEPGSPADRAGIRAGEWLYSINGQPITDVFDYRVACAVKNPVMGIGGEEGDPVPISLRKNENRDPGLIFEDAMMDESKTCSNTCVFCFIDQMPPGLRDTLYIKDDDTRLSFLTGNYVTLTNISDEELDRICRHHLSPINISVHATDPGTRIRLLRNRKAGRIMEQICRLIEAGITVHCQIVLCRGLNDGEQLERTLDDLTACFPGVYSISVVPVGLTEHREELPLLTPYDARAAAEVVDRVTSRQVSLAARHNGRSVVWLADEFYLMAGRECPAADHYAEFPQLENGVGMLALFLREYEQDMAIILRNRSRGYLQPALRPEPGKTRHIGIATGMLSGDVIRRLAERLAAEVNRIAGEEALKIRVFPVENRLFGSGVTVSGLLSGADLLRGLEGKEHGSTLLLPENMFREGENVFLDNMTLEELSDRLSVPVRKVPVHGGAFIRKILGRPWTDYLFGRRFSLVRHA